jgi:predicted nucleic acid-binding protein
LIVADTNLIVALALKTSASADADAVRKRDNDWAAPLLWESEFRNALMGMLRAGDIGMQTALGAYKFAAENITAYSVSTSAVLRLAEANGLTAYDAEFAALAEWLDCKCVSYDPDLLNAKLAEAPQEFLSKRSSS